MRPETIEAVRRLVNAAGFRGTQEAIEKYGADLTSTEARWLLAEQLPRHSPTSREHRVIAARLRALERCISDGPDAVFSDYDGAADAIGAVVNAADWDEVRGAIERRRHLLLDEVADIAFADLVMQPLAPDDESQVLGAWNLIEHCRELGVEAAIEAQMRPRRGVALGSEASASIAASESAADLEQRLRETPEIASRIARRAEGQLQLEQWADRDDYAAAMQALAGPSDLDTRTATCRSALERIDRDQSPIVWALVALDLADALRSRAGYDAPTPMTEVIALYRAALARLTPEGEPAQFVHAQRYLGDAYLLDSEGDQSTNIEHAVACYETALAMLRPKVERVEWAATASHLGEALLRRTHGDPTLHVERSITLLAEAIDILEQQNDRPMLAAARMSLAAAYTRRLHGSRDESLRAAARHLRDAAEGVEPHEQHLGLWAMATTHLGEVYLTRAQLDLVSRANLLRQAERCFRTALSRGDVGRRVRARALAGLGWALADQYDRGDDALAEAIASYQTAIADLETLGSAYDVERAHVHRNLALAYGDRAELDEQSASMAEQHFDSALAVFGVEYPVQRRDTLRPLGAMYFGAGRWAQALTRFEEAIDLSAGALTGQHTERGKEAEVAGNRSLYGAAAYCRVRLGRPGEALETIERGKVRMMSEALAWKESPRPGDGDDEPALMRARENVTRLEATLRANQAVRDARLHAQLGEQLRDAYRHLVSLQARHGEGPASPMALSDILAEIPAGGALVAPVVTTRGGAVLVVPSRTDRVSAEHVVELESFDVAAVGELLAGPRGAGGGGWLNAYLTWQRDAESFEALLRALHDLTTALWDRLMGPVHERLTALGVREGAPVMLVPSGWLGLLPLHAAQRAVAGQWRAFVDDFAVSYVPSAAVARVCRTRLAARERRGGGCVVVANPTGDLRFANSEAAAIAGLVGVRPAPNDCRVIGGDDATVQAVRDAVGGRQYVHFACHARFDWSNPAESGLELAGDTWLRIEDILSPAMRLSSARVVTLSACETGMAEFRSMPDEFIGLPGAFIEAGASAVVSSLWPVDDVSTSLLMAELYRRHFGGMGVADALRGAQRWLREATAKDLGFAEAHPDVAPFAHPYYWAGFTVTGVDAGPAAMSDPAPRV